MGVCLCLELKMIHVLFALPCNSRGAAAQLARLSLLSKKQRAIWYKQRAGVSRQEQHKPTHLRVEHSHYIVP